MNAVSITMTMLAQRMRTNPKWSIIISIITYREKYNASDLGKTHYYYMFNNPKKKMDRNVWIQNRQKRRLGTNSLR